MLIYSIRLRGISKTILRIFYTSCGERHLATKARLTTLASRKEHFESDELSIGESDVSEQPFSNFNISQGSIDRLKARGIHSLFPVQSKTYGTVYGGQDCIVQARTGTGKTLAFSLPLTERLQENRDGTSGTAPKVLVLTPTRELAKQICDDFMSVSRSLKITSVYGGVGYGPQVSALRNGVDILVGTPGRILDHVEKQTLDLTQLKHVVLDETDRMLDMGFEKDVENIIKKAYRSNGVLFTEL